MTIALVGWLNYSVKTQLLSSEPVHEYLHYAIKCVMI